MDFQLPDGYEWHVWKPRIDSWFPKDAKISVFSVWLLFHLFHVFSNRDYAVLEIFRGNDLVHRSCIFPRYFRFPFMRVNDLQIGDVWTSPDHRKKGLATTALTIIPGALRTPERDFWYVVEESNKGSIRVAEKAGFVRFGEGEKRRRLGNNLFGYFAILRH